MTQAQKAAAFDQLMKYADDFIKQLEQHQDEMDQLYRQPPTTEHYSTQIGRMGGKNMVLKSHIDMFKMRKEAI